MSASAPPVPKPRPPAGDTWSDGFSFAICLACCAICPECDRYGMPERPWAGQLHCWHDFEDRPAQLCRASAIIHAAHYRVALDGPA